MLEDQLDRCFPDLALIGDGRLRGLVGELWRTVSERNPLHTDIERIPVHPTLQVERHGSLGAHIRGQMAISKALVPTYQREWRIDLSLDHFLACAAVHDAAKVVEFVEQDGKLVATPGFDHALYAGRLARDLGFPPEVSHMVAVHTYLGPLRLPRMRAAQLFQFMDPLCLPVFPEDGKSAVERHLEANKWSVAAPPDDVP
ncbi:MAG: hypothetical protein ACRDGT_12490 [Candidatus Limnocylindria bacterium]